MTGVGASLCAGGYTSIADTGALNPAYWSRPMIDPSVWLRRHACLAVLGLAAMLAAPGPAAAEGEVNIYSFREPGLINPLLEAFSKKTGIKANVVFAKNGLIE